MEHTFDETIHMCCPECGFEVVYLDENEQCVFYVYRHAVIDRRSGNFEFVSKEENGVIMCNHVDCNWVLT